MTFSPAQFRTLCSHDLSLFSLCCFRLDNFKSTPIFYFEKSRPGLIRTDMFGPKGASGVFRNKACFAGVKNRFAHQFYKMVALLIYIRSAETVFSQGRKKASLTNFIRWSHSLSYPECGNCVFTGAKTLNFFTLCFGKQALNSGFHDFL